jgi:hypothetical protein
VVNEKKNSASQPAWGATAASILNGCFGDYLNDRDNGLAIDMAFYQNNRPLELSADALRAANPTDKLCVLVHGLCVTKGSGIFRRPGALYGRTARSRLHAIALRYNTDAFPTTVRYSTRCSNSCSLLSGAGDELILIGHNMGGLVLRAACRPPGRSMGGQGQPRLLPAPA